MMHSKTQHGLTLFLVGIGLLALTGCGATMQEFLRGVEPLIDGAVKMAGDSVGASAEKAVADHLGKQWSGGEIAGVVSGSIVALAGAAKAWAMAWNRVPDDVELVEG